MRNNIMSIDDKTLEHFRSLLRDTAQALADCIEKRRLADNVARAAQTALDGDFGTGDVHKLIDALEEWEKYR